MISVDVSQVLKELQAYRQDTIRRLENMVKGLSYIISKTAIENTPLGNSEQYADLYRYRAERTGLAPEEGFARGSWQVNTTGQFSMQALYGATSGTEALTLVKSDIASYKIGQTVYVGNKGFYIRLLENNYSQQTNELGIMKPTLDSIMRTYQVDLVRLFKEG